MTDLVHFEPAALGTAAPFYPRPGEAVFHHVLACVDNSPQSHSALAHAAAIAEAMSARLTIIRVLEPTASGTVPTDPVEWRMCHRDAEAELLQNATRLGSHNAETVVVDGSAAEQICTWVHDHAVDLTVLGFGGTGNWPTAGLGSIARRIVDSVEGAVLLVPSRDDDGEPIHYRKVLTPLDGSSRAESALPIVVGLANAHEADIVLVHAAPGIEVTEIGPLEAEAVNLREQLHKRNERVAAKYLKKVQSWLPVGKHAAKARVIASGDTRQTLTRAIMDEDPDVIVLSATGMSGRKDIAIGSVADYMVNHAEKPILLVRSSDGIRARIRRPGDTVQTVRMPGGAFS